MELYIRTKKSQDNDEPSWWWEIYSDDPKRYLISHSQKQINSFLFKPVRIKQIPLNQMTLLDEIIDFLPSS